MFLVYRVNEQFDEFYPVMPEDAIYDVFHRFHPHNLDLIHGTHCIRHFDQGDVYIDCGDWVKGYSTYYNTETREKFLVVDTRQEQDNPTVRRLIRDWRIVQLFNGRT